jgi:hypothetical protein
MTHLTPDELIDAIEGTLSSEREAHLAACDVCLRERAGLSSVLGEARQTSIPEPSPLFWQHLSARVNDSIDRDVADDTRWPSWLRWQVLAPLGAVAMIIMALMIAVPKQDPALVTLDESSIAADPPEAIDALAAVVGDLDLETASAAGVIEPGVAEQAVLHLTAEEQQELARLLKAELLRAKS